MSESYYKQLFGQHRLTKESTARTSFWHTARIGLVGKTKKCRYRYPSHLEIYTLPYFKPDVDDVTLQTNLKNLAVLPQLALPHEYRSLQYRKYKSKGAKNRIANGLANGSFCSSCRRTNLSEIKEVGPTKIP